MLKISCWERIVSDCHSYNLSKKAKKKKILHPKNDTGENRRFDHRILDWTSWTASKETSLEVLVVFKRSKYINIS